MANTVKLTHPNRKGQFKIYKKADVEAAKANGWIEWDKPKPKTESGSIDWQKVDKGRRQRAANTAKYGMTDRESRKFQRQQRRDTRRSQRQQRRELKWQAS